MKVADQPMNVLPLQSPDVGSSGTSPAGMVEPWQYERVRIVEPPTIQLTLYAGFGAKFIVTVQLLEGVTLKVLPLCDTVAAFTGATV